jgi:hypothetical protein
LEQTKNMEIKIGKDNGHIILDDNTGKIMTVLVKNLLMDVSLWNMYIQWI